MFVPHGSTMKAMLMPRASTRRNVTEGLILPLEPGEKILQVLHFEPDVIDGTAGGGNRRRG